MAAGAAAWRWPHARRCAPPPPPPPPLSPPPAGAELAGRYESRCNLDIPALSSSALPTHHRLAFVKCSLLAQEWSEARDRRLCHSCRAVRPLRSKHSPSLAVDKCVPRFDHHCPWVGNTVGYNNHPWFLAYVTCAMGCLWSCALIVASFLQYQTPTSLGMFNFVSVCMRSVHALCVVGNLLLTALLTWERCS